MKPEDNLSQEHIQNIEEDKREKDSLHDLIVKSMRDAAIEDTQISSLTPTDPAAASPSASGEDGGGGQEVEYKSLENEGINRMSESVAAFGKQAALGVGDGIDSMLNLPRDLGMADYDKVDIFPDGDEPETTGQALVRGAAQFATGLPAGGAVTSSLRYSLKGAAYINRYRKTTGVAGAAGAATSKARKAAGVAADFGKVTLAGGIADFAAFDGTQGRLTDIIDEHSEDMPWLGALVVEGLKSNEDDSAFIGRVKNAVEGAAIGVPFDALVGLRQAFKNKKFLNQMKADNTTEGYPAGFANETTSKADELLLIDGDLKSAENVRELINGGQFSEEQIQKAIHFADPDETATAAAKRIGELPAEESLLVKTINQKPEIAEKAKEGAEALDRLIDDLTTKKTQASSEWMELRVGNRSSLLPDEQWKKYDSNIDGVLDKAEVARITAHNKIPKLDRLEKLRESGAIEEAQRAAGPLVARQKTLPVFNKETKGWDGDPDFWGNIEKEGRLGKSDIGRFKRALKDENVNEAVRLANEADLVIEVDLPRNNGGKPETFKGFFRRTHFFREVRESFPPGPNSSRAGARRSGKSAEGIKPEETNSLYGNLDDQIEELKGKISGRIEELEAKKVDNKSGELEKLKAKKKKFDKKSDELEKLKAEKKDRLSEDPELNSKIEKLKAEIIELDALGDNLGKPGRKKGKKSGALSNAETKRRASEWAKSIANNSDAVSILNGLPNATSENLVEFGRAMFGDVSLDRLPKVMVGMRQMMFQMQAQLKQVSGKIASNTASEMEIAEFDQLSTLLAQVVDAFSGNASRIGQSLQALRVSPSKKPSNDWLFANNDLLKQSDPEQLKKLAIAINGADSSEMLNQAVALSSTFHRASSSIAEFQVNAFLSAVQTTGVNVASGALQTLYLPLEAAAGSLTRLDIRGFKTEMQAVLGLVDFFRGTVKMSARAMDLPVQSVPLTTPFKNAGKTFIDGDPKLDARTALEEQQYAIHSKNYSMQQGTYPAKFIDALGWIVRTPSRLMMSVDEMIKAANMNAKLSRDGYSAAWDAWDASGGKMTNNEFKEFKKKYVMDAAAWQLLPSDGLEASVVKKQAKTNHDEALDYARRAVFQEDLTEKSWGEAVSKMANNHPLAKVILPFVRTPSNIFKFAFKRTPLLNNLSKEYRNEIAKGGAVAEAAKNRTRIGGMMFASAMVMAAEGRLTGGGPTNPRQREMWLLAGFKPYSINFGDKATGTDWHQFKRGDPISWFMGVSGDLSQIMTDLEDENEAEEIAMAAVMALQRNLNSRSYLSGAVKALNAAQSVDRYGWQFLEGLAGGLVPNIVAHSNKFGLTGTDSAAMREVDGMIDAVLSRAKPELLPPRTNAWGEVENYPVGIGWGLGNPFYSAKNTISPDTLVKLRDGEYNLKDAPPDQRAAYAAVQIGYGFSMNRFDKIMGQKLTPNERYEYTLKAGPELKKNLTWLVNQAFWSNLSSPVPGYKEESQKYKAFDAVINAVMDRAKSQMINENPELRAKIEKSGLDVAKAQNNGSLPDTVLNPN